MMRCDRPATHIRQVDGRFPHLVCGRHTRSQPGGRWNVVAPPLSTIPDALLPAYCDAMQRYVGVLRKERIAAENREARWAGRLAAGWSLRDSARNPEVLRG